MKVDVLQRYVLLVPFLLAFLLPACRGTNDADDALPTPDEQGVLHRLTETSAAQLLGFQPVRPVTLPPDFTVQELWGQASLLRGTATDGRLRWGAPYVAIYTLWPTGESTLPGGMQLHQSPVDPIPTRPGGVAPEQIIAIGTKQVQKTVEPVGDTGIANVIYRWTGATTNLNLLVIATTGGLLTEADVETMIAALPD